MDDTGGTCLKRFIPVPDPHQYPGRLKGSSTATSPDPRWIGQFGQWSLDIRRMTPEFWNDQMTNKLTPDD